MCAQRRRHETTKRGGIVVGLLISILLASSLPANAYTTTGHKWSSGNITYFANTNGVYLTAYQQAASGWTATDVNMSASSSSSWTSVAGYYGNNGYDGYTTTQQSIFGTIHTVSMELNKTYLDPYPATKKKVVALHEFGHGLGLDHSTASGNPVMTSCPACAYNLGTTGLKTDDINGVNSIY